MTAGAVALASIGVFIDVLGLAMFRRHMRIVDVYDGNHTSAYHVTTGAAVKPSLMGSTAHDMNMHAVFLHPLADLYMHAGMLVATSVAHYMQYHIMHSISTFVVAVLICKSCYTLFSYTASILLQTTPSYMVSIMDGIKRDISFYDGVLEIRGCHVWSITPKHLVASLIVRVRSDANITAITNYIHQRLDKYVQHLTIQIDEDTPYSSINP